MEAIGKIIDSLQGSGAIPKDPEPSKRKPKKQAVDGGPGIHRFLASMDKFISGGRHHARIPGSFLNMPAYFELSGLPFKVLTVLFFYNFKRDKIARPGVNTIMKALYGIEYIRRDKTAESRYRSIMRAIDTLKAGGFVYQLRRASKGHTAEYYLARNEMQRKAIRRLNAWSVRSCNKGVNA